MENFYAVRRLVGFHAQTQKLDVHYTNRFGCESVNCFLKALSRKSNAVLFKLELFKRYLNV